MIASPQSHYRFLYWSDGDASNPRTIIVSKDTSLTAVFAVDTMYLIQLRSKDISMGSVYGAGAYLKHEQINITATANYGFHFKQWSDGDTSNPRVITVLGDTNLTAIFDTNTYNVTLIASDTTRGSVRGDGNYTYLSQILITATVNAGYQFLCWSDGDTNNSRKLTIIQDTVLTAYFMPILLIQSYDTNQGNV